MNHEEMLSIQSRQSIVSMYIFTGFETYSSVWPISNFPSIVVTSTNFSEFQSPFCGKGEVFQIKV